MKVERNILSKKNIAELEDLVNRLDVVVLGAKHGMLKRKLEQVEEEYRKAMIKELRACDKRIKEKKARLAKLREK